MAINYVRFQRGTQQAYEALKNAGTLDKNTLYFIENENGTSALYMGVRLITSEDSTSSIPTSLKDLSDVIITETGANSFLVKDSETDNWVSKSFADIVALIGEELKIDATIAESVKNLENSIVNIESDIEVLEESIATKVDTETVNEELAKKADITTVNAINETLDSKANAADVNKELAKKADIVTVNEALNSKANISDLNATNEELAKKADTITVNEALNLKANANEVYTKEEVNNKVASDISEAIANADHLKRKKIDNVEDIDVNALDANQYIYMVPTGLQEDDDKYDEYMVIDGVIEKVGSWEVDLSDYAKKSDLDLKVNVDENARLLTLAEGEKLARIEDGAQVNIINSISNYFTIDLENNKQLDLKDLPINKITNLQETLNNKVDIQPGYTLLSPEEQQKLAALVIGDDNNIEISGSVNADNVQGLAEWLNRNAATTKGLSENNLTDDLYNKLNQSLFITAVDISQLQVDNGKLSIIEIDKSKVTGLEEALNAKANQTAVDQLLVSVDDISKSLSNYVAKVDYDKDIAEIRDILTWKEMG